MADDLLDRISSCADALLSAHLALAEYNWWASADPLAVPSPRLLVALGAVERETAALAYLLRGHDQQAS